MRKFAACFVMLVAVGCASPAQTYVESDAAAWKPIDPFIDAWIDLEPNLKASDKDALHDLMKGRRARIAHALAQFHKDEVAAPASGSTK